jgi:hypothetical protein
MPDLEDLRKQAKLILRWHRERHCPVAAQIRELLPRFLTMTDAEILATSFKLSGVPQVPRASCASLTWGKRYSGRSTGLLQFRLHHCRRKTRNTFYLFERLGRP